MDERDRAWAAAALGQGERLLGDRAGRPGESLPSAPSTVTRTTCEPHSPLARCNYQADHYACTRSFRSIVPPKLISASSVSGSAASTRMANVVGFYSAVS